MLKRKCMNELINWKLKPDKKSLLVYGARQIGKTTSIREFAYANYESIIEINFIEQPELKLIFEGDINVDTIKLNILVRFPNVKFIDGKTLIFLDEIQECENAISALKFFSQQSAIDCIATGSALGINYNMKSSYPVGYVEYCAMHSLDFEEFLWAKNVDETVIQKVKECCRNVEKVPEMIHRQMLRYFKEYMVVGGMPEVVDAYILSNDLESVDVMQKRLYQDYLFDIARFALPNEKIKAEKCYQSILQQLSKDNHKFQYSVIESKATATKFGNSIEWLKNAFMVIQVCNLTRMEYPLEAYVDESNFRLYHSDVGMLMARLNPIIKNAILLENDIESGSQNFALGTAKGSLFEAVAADVLGKKGIQQIYFYKDVKSTSEIEFIIYGERGLVPIEIKAGKKRANSLGKILESDIIAYGYKMSSQNVGRVGKKITMPIYMLTWI